MRKAFLGNPSSRLGLGLALAVAACAAAPAVGCSGGAGTKDAPDGGSNETGNGASSGGQVDASDDAAPGNPKPGPDAGGSSADGEAEAGADAGADAGAVSKTDAGSYPAGWLYTAGGKIYLSDGTSTGTQWMGRGVNTDDIFLCGNNSGLSMTSPEKTVETIIGGIISGWKPNFLRMSLAMDSYGTVVSWLNNPSKYAVPMTNVITNVGTYPGVHVLVTLRSDASMIGQDKVDGDPEATGLPSDSKTTPDATSFPTGTDAVYVALVDAFANAGYVMFGLTNEPGGNKLSSDTIAAAMTHAVGTIRAEEDRMGMPHHIVSVQGNGWTSDISFYAKTPIAYDNVVYEVHGYPPSTSSYTYSNIPVILGEYGSLTSSNSAAFYADVENKKIPTLAWDFDPYSNCAPDLVNVTQSATSLMPTAWGSIVQAYLLAHAQ